MSEPGDGAASAGALLRAARERQGLHIAALAAAIKVSPRKLDALENDRWDELPDATFTRALAQTVCRTLKIDARAVLELLPRAGAVVLQPSDSGLNAPFRDSGDRVSAGLSGLAIRPMVWAALILMGAALAVYLMPEGMLTRKPAPRPVAASAAEPVLAAASSPQVAGPADVPASAREGALPEAASAAALGKSFANAATALSPAAPAAASAAVAAQIPPARAAALAATGQATPASASPAAAGPPRLVQLRASDASWVEIRDAADRVLLSRTLEPGESIGVDGSPPLRLIIGNAAATEVGFRGRAVDLTPATRENVARLELQ